MPRRALVQYRPWLVLSLIAAIALPLFDQTALGGVWLMVIKTSAVGFLALYAAQRTKGLRAGLFVLALAMSALGDFASVARKWVALALLIAVPIMSWLLSGDVLIALYSVGLGGMAMAAWLSLFPQSRVGLGALLFVLSDWLIFSRLGPYDLAPLPDLLIWPTYYVGQFLIATGVVQTLRRFRW